MGETILNQFKKLKFGVKFFDDFYQIEILRRKFAIFADLK